MGVAGVVDGVRYIVAIVNGCSLLGMVGRWGLKGCRVSLGWSREKRRI